MSTGSKGSTEASGSGRAPALTSHQRQYLKKLAHPMEPLVQVGAAGLTDGVCAAVDTALEDHELIKVRFGKGIDEDKKQLANELATRVGAQVCQVIGRVVVLYRSARDPSKRKILLKAARKP